METMTTIGQRLKQIRLERGLSQAALAKQANVSQGTIGNIESGQRGYGESIVDIAAALHVTPAFLRLEEGTQDAQSSSCSTHPTVERLYQAMRELGLAPGPTAAAALLKLPNSQTVKNWESRGMSAEGMVTAATRGGVNAAYLSEGHEPKILGSPRALGGITLPASLDTITAAITALSPPDREQLAKALAILAVAPDSAEAKARVLVLLQPAHSVPGTESKAFQPPVPQSSTVNPTTA